MRIAIVHYSAPPIIGGVERIVAEQARVLARHGHDVTVVCGNDDARVEGERITVRVLPALRSGSPGPLAPQGAEAPGLGMLPSLLEGHEAIIVHNLFTMPFNLPATRVLRQLAVEWNKVHWINWVHDVAAINPNYAHLPWDDLEHAMLKQPAPNCTNVAVSSVRRREYLRMLHLPESACRVTPNGVDVALLLGLSSCVQAIVQEQRLWERDYVLLHPSRVLRRKNIEFSLQIAGALTGMGLDVALLITGAPDPHNADGARYAEELRDIIEKENLADVACFLGGASPLEDEDVTGLYRIVDAVLFPSVSEGYGLPVVEAALHDVPVFCSDIPVHREVGQNTARLISIDADPAAVAASIAEDEGVTRRYVRRVTVAGALDWSAIYHDHLGPLLGLDRDDASGR